MIASGPALLSLGSVNADFQLRVDVPPHTAETLPGRDFIRLSGGKAANVAFLARSLGHPAVLLGRLGDDDLRQQALGAMRKAGVSLHGISTAAGTATAVSLITVGPNGKTAIALAGNANDRWDEPARRHIEQVIGAAHAGSILVADYEVPAVVVAGAVAAAARRDLRIVIDPSFADRAEQAVLAQAFALAPNVEEAGVLAGLQIDGPQAAARAAGVLADRGPVLVCVKLADGGCVFRFGGRTTLIRPLALDVVDSTGAGDAFTGALAVGLLEGLAPAEAALFATAASHCAVTGYGSQPSYPSRSEIEALVPALRAGTEEVGRQ